MDANWKQLLMTTCMLSKPKRSKRMGRTPLTRAQLLPIAPSTARTFSLKNHLALVAMRNGRGNADLASELIKTLYLTFLVCEQDRRDLPIATYLTAEAVLRASIHDSETGDAWRIADDQCQAIEAILCVHDALLASTPLYRIEEARVRLSRILKAGRFPDLEAMHRVGC